MLWYFVVYLLIFALSALACLRQLHRLKLRPSHHLGNKNSLRVAITAYCVVSVDVAARRADGGLEISKDPAVDSASLLNELQN